MKIVIQHNTHELENVVGDGGFDSEFYESSYKELIPPKSNAYQHFKEIGCAQGLLPNRVFDPLVFRFLQHQGLIQDQSSTALEFFESKSSEQYEHLNFRSVLAFFPDLTLERHTPEFGDKKKFALSNAQYSKTFANESFIEIEHDNRKYKLDSPPPSFFLDRISTNDPFAMVRVPQGYWDVLVYVDQVFDQIVPVLSKAGFNDKEIFLLAIRACKELMPHHGALEENLINEISWSVEQNVDSESYYRSLSFKGFPTRDENPFYFSNEKMAQTRCLNHMTRFFSSDQRALDATLWKRWLISGSLKCLPDICKSHPVILVGPEELSLLGKRWQLDHFVHLQIPRENSQRIRHHILDIVSEEISKAISQMPKRRPILMFQCGGTFALWLIARLYKQYPDVFYIDFGQALNAWFYDNPENTKLLWNRVFLKSIVINTELEKYYQEKMGRNYSKLMEKFSWYENEAQTELSNVKTFASKVKNFIKASGERK